MKRFLFTLIYFLFAALTFAQVRQSGRVLEYNGKEQKTPLKRVVQIAVDGASSTVSDVATGGFTLDFNSKKKGDRIQFASNPRAMGYELMNTRELESWNINPARPINIIFCSRARFDELCSKYYNISLKSYEDKLARDRKKLSDALNANKLQKAEYVKKLGELQTEYNNNLANIDKYVDQFARIDQSELSETESAILQLVDAGRIDEAIAEYDKFDATSKIIEANKNIQTLETAKKKVESEIDSQKAAKDSLLAVFFREIDLLKMAGGKENYDKAGMKLRQLADADTTNLKVVWNCAEFIALQRDFKAAIPYFEICLNNCGDDVSKKADSQQWLGDLYYNLNDFKQSERYILQSIETLKSQGGDYSNERTALMADAMILLSKTYSSVGDYQKSEKVLLECLEKAERLFATDSVEYRKSLADTQYYLGKLYVKIKDYNKSEKYYLLGLCNYKKAFENDEQYGIYVALAQEELGYLYLSTKEYQKSEIYYLQSLENFNILYKNNPDRNILYLAIIQFNLAIVYYKTPDYKNSEKYFIESYNNYKLEEKNEPGKNTARIARIQIYLGNIFEKRDADHAKAADMYKKSIDNFMVLYKQSKELYVSDLSSAFKGLSVSYANQGMFDKAIETIDTAIKMFPDEESLKIQKDKIIAAQKEKETK